MASLNQYKFVNLCGHGFPGSLYRHAGLSEDSTHDFARVLLPLLNDVRHNHSTFNCNEDTYAIIAAILTALLAENAMSEIGARSILHMAIFAAAVSVTIYALLDLDDPRSERFS